MMQCLLESIISTNDCTLMYIFPAIYWRQLVGDIPLLLSTKDSKLMTWIFLLTTEVSTLTALDFPTIYWRRNIDDIGLFFYLLKTLYQWCRSPLQFPEGSTMIILVNSVIYWKQHINDVFPAIYWRNHINYDIGQSC